MIRAVLLALTLVLTGLLVMQWRHWPPPLPSDQSERRDGAAVPEPGEPANGAATRLAPPEAKETFASIAERPLFRPQRKPPEPPSAEPSGPVSTEAGSLEGIDLSAVLIAPGVTMAWIKDPSAPDLKRLRPGDEHAGWSVQSILADRVVMERQGETNELILRDFSKTQTTPPAAPGPAAPKPAVRQPQSPQRAPQGGQPPGADQRVAPPRPPQQKPNARRPIPQRPQ